MSFNMEQKRESLKKILPDVSRETVEHLFAFEQLVIKWQKHINLVAASTLNTIWERHILDSVQLFRLKPEMHKWCDIGSGGGFPGIVMAILLKQKQRGHIDLIESKSKKVVFLRTVIADLDLPAQVHQKRIEAMEYHLLKPQIVTARALAALDTLLDLTHKWLTGDTVALFHKGKGYRDEIQATYSRWKFDMTEYPSIIDDQSIILEISRVKQMNRVAV